MAEKTEIVPRNIDEEFSGLCINSASEFFEINDI